MAKQSRKSNQSLDRLNSSQYLKLAKELKMNIFSMGEEEFNKEYQLLTDLNPTLQSLLFMNDIYLVQHKSTSKKILLVHYLNKIDMFAICEELDFDEINFADEKTMNLFIQKYNSIGKEINEELGASDYITALLTKARVSNVSDIHISLFGRELIIEFSSALGKTEVGKYGIKEASIVRNTLEYLSNVENGTAFYDSKIVIDSHEYRISFFETEQGYGATIRVYANDEFGDDFSLKALDYTDRIITIIEDICLNQNGAIFYTAQTGQGKTTTQYANLQWLQKRGLKVVAVESPVEKRLNKINQIDLTRYESADEQFKLTAKKAIKLFLRAKPDVINMGEIRDGEDAELAYTASTTGHLVFGTLHTNSVYTAFMRLTKETNLSIEDIKAITRGIIYQQLTRKLCPHCKVKADKEGHFKANKKGCSHCYFGYAKLRTPIVEIAKFPFARDYNINDTSTYDAYISLSDSAKEKYDLGIIDFEHYDALINGRREPIIQFKMLEEDN
jgi:type II secretory ATPase GspE/PulE/Tfp pilus assembly ATPase PilB-like protein